MRKRITITIESNLLEWVDKKVNEREYGNRSHAIEYGIKTLMFGDI